MQVGSLFHLPRIHASAPAPQCIVRLSYVTPSGRAYYIMLRDVITLTVATYLICETRPQENCSKGSISTGGCNMINKQNGWARMEMCGGFILAPIRPNTSSIIKGKAVL